MKQSSKAWIFWLCFAVVAMAVVPLNAGEQKPTPRTESGETTQEPADSKTKVSPFVKAMGGRGTPSKAKVYSNSDLDRMYGGSSPDEETDSEPAANAKPRDASAEPDSKATPSPDAAEDGEGKDALAQLFEGEAARKEHVAQVAEAEKKVTEAKARVAELQKRKLALQNPFLARPGAPEEEAEKWETMDGDQRVQQTEVEVQTARSALAEAEAELSRLRGSGP